jgi:DNA-binding NtrC family response regulator
MNAITQQENIVNSRSGRILVVDDHRQARESMADVLRAVGHEVVCCASAPEALKTLESENFDCILTDLKMPGMNGVEFIIQLEQRRLGVQVVMVTAHASVATAVEAMRHGAFDYIEKPFNVDQLERLVSQAMRHGRLVRQDARNEVKNDAAKRPVMIGSSQQMKLLRDRIAQIAPTPETVLIIGESGTGKELVARAVHASSDRNGKEMISLNCPVLSAQLMESELFGHERGAFTGADSQRMGRFESADGGTLMLDEISEIDLRLQAKLLRVLQEKNFERVGSSQTIHIDVRVLATTNRNLQAEVADGKFREDLYFRLAVVPLHVPALRERREDVPELVEYFFNRSAIRLGREPGSLDASAMQLLMDYYWPGNVRELENIITRTSILHSGRPVSADDLRRWLIVDPSASQNAVDDVRAGISLEEMERKLIEATLEKFGGHRAKTAEALGIGLRTLSGKLRQYGYAPREKTFSKAG